MRGRRYADTHLRGLRRDTEGNHGAFEASLIGTKLAKPEEPLEIIRTIHSFDPCLACATHVLDNKGEELVSVKVR